MNTASETAPISILLSFSHKKSIYYLYIFTGMFLNQNVDNNEKNCKNHNRFHLNAKFDWNVFVTNSNSCCLEISWVTIYLIVEKKKSFSNRLVIAHCFYRNRSQWRCYLSIEHDKRKRQSKCSDKIGSIPWISKCWMVPHHFCSEWNSCLYFAIRQNA